MRRTYGVPFVPNPVAGRSAVEDLKFDKQRRRGGKGRIRSDEVMERIQLQLHAETVEQEIYDGRGAEYELVAKNFGFLCNITPLQ